VEGGGGEGRGAGGRGEEEGGADFRVDAGGVWHGVALWVSLSLLPQGVGAARGGVVRGGGAGEGEGEGGGGGIEVDANCGSAAGYMQGLCLVVAPVEVRCGDFISGLCLSLSLSLSLLSYICTCMHVCMYVRMYIHTYIL